MALDLIEGKPGHFPETFRSTLSSDSQIVRPYKVALLSGVMELALEHEQGGAELYQKLSKENPGTESFERMALQAPLKDRHWQASREQFSELRAGPLSSQTLRAWQNYLMVKYPAQIPSIPRMSLDD
jgi:hypothetical protein